MKKISMVALFILLGCNKYVPRECIKGKTYKRVDFNTWVEDKGSPNCITDKEKENER